MQKKYKINIIGAGLAGCEAAWFLANKGIKVTLYEMRPKVKTDIHKTADFSELVCSNSLKSTSILDASGLLKEEMKMFNSLVLESAMVNKIEGGTSLMVDRSSFSSYITNKIRNHPNIKVINREVKKISKNSYTIIATGPLTSDKLSSFIGKKYCSDDLYFYDAVAPIIKKEGIDFNQAFYKSRYDKGEATYINFPFTKEQYELFYKELIKAETVKLHDFENVFEACMPIESLAKRGFDALRYGPLRPVGITHNGIKYFAILQARQDDFNSSLYNLVGFQTNLTFSEQKRILSFIPGLENANIVRYGVIHRNTYINSPKILHNLCLNTNHKVYFAGQITGVEGYMESASNGILCASLLYQKLLGINKIITPSNYTIMGGLLSYLNAPNSSFVPMNANYSIVPEVEIKHKKERREYYYNRGISNFKEYVDYINGLS
jgi:methylenetetrahydrofolate--tRNA-(uracil-5-)-methyltransferase